MSTTEKNIPAFEAKVAGMGVEAPKRKVAVVGGGPSGSLAAIYFAQRNWQVTLFEKRPDIRDPENASNLSSRTINLALSHRGITALKGTNLGLDKKLLSKAIPTKGRMIHTKTNAQLSQLYGINDQCINSIDRNEMNGILLSELEKFPHAKVIFDHTLDRCDLDAGRLYFINAKKGSFVFDCDLIVGSDGINSTVRQSILQRTRANISMQYIDHDYCELTIPAAKGLKSDKFQLDNHHLHIWPRQTYMMTALANLNGSFSCAFFAPREMFDAMDTKEKFLKLFDKEFSDVMPLVDRDTLAQEFMDNPRGSLATVKCDPHYYKGRAVLIGDAAHCMVPFFGQGMNSSLEDVTKLFEQLDAAHDEDEKSISLVKEYDTKVIERALAKYSQHRTKDAAAICDLSLRNYIEMRKSVVTWSYQARKQLETFLYHYIPNTVAPLYIMVTFSSMRYTEAMRRWDRQTEILSNAIRSVAILLLMVIVFLVYLSTPKSLLSSFPC